MLQYCFHKTFISIKGTTISEIIFGMLAWIFFVLLPARVLSILNATNWYIFLFHKVKFTSKVSNDFRISSHVVQRGLFFGYIESLNCWNAMEPLLWRHKFREKSDRNSLCAAPLGGRCCALYHIRPSKALLQFTLTSCPSHHLASCINFLVLCHD